MKKKIMKLISCILVSVSVCLMFMPVFGMAAQQGQKVPVISVPGFMASEIRADKDDPNSELVWPPQADDIVSAITGAVPALSRYLLDDDEDGFCEEVTPLVNKIFESCVMNADGTPKGNSGVCDYYPDPKEINCDGNYTFRYDWRKDPIEIAGELNSFIDYILQNSGSSKVSITSHSLGGLITTTYMTLYGDGKLKNVIMNSTAVYGESFNGELLSGNIHLCGDALVKYLRFAFEDSEMENLLNTVFETLQKTGLLDLICNAGNDLIDKFSYRVIPESIAPLFAGWLTIWAMIPDEYINDAMDYIFNTVYQNDAEHEILKQKVVAFNEQVRCKKTEVLKLANDHTNFFVIARYGYSALPLTPAYNRMTDCTIDTVYASFGAICAEYNGVLSQEQTAGTDERYISPDRQINASTCLFPEQTWFIKNLSHSKDNEDFNKLMNIMLAADEQYTVDTLPGFSRFMTAQGERLDKTPGAQQEKTTFFDKIKAFFSRITDWFKQVFNGLTGK